MAFCDSLGDGRRIAYGTHVECCIFAAPFSIFLIIYLRAMLGDGNATPVRRKSHPVAGVGERLSNWLFFPKSYRRTSFTESVSILLRRKLKIWPERVSIFRRNWPFRGNNNKASFITFYGRLRVDYETSAGRPFCVSANCCFVVCLFKNAFVTLTEKFNLCVAYSFAKRMKVWINFAHGVRWRSTFGLWFWIFRLTAQGAILAMQTADRRVDYICACMV